MINKRDVITMRVPYPSVSSPLAYSAHMYICDSVCSNERGFIKCQTLKPYMINSKEFKHFVDEKPDINRNPFKRTTRIDCDKHFSSKRLIYDDQMKTSSRPDVCLELFKKAEQELLQDGFLAIEMNEPELLSLNPLIKQSQ